MKFHALLLPLLCGVSGIFSFDVQAADAGAVRFVNPDLQIGALTNGQNVSVTFVLTNSSDKVVKIAAVDSSCECTALQSSPEQIPAHGSGKFEFVFNSSRSIGAVTQSVEVQTADGQTVTGQFHVSVEAPRGGDAKITAPWLPDRGDGTYQNPVLFADYSDPDAIRVGLVVFGFDYALLGLRLVYIENRRADRAGAAEREIASVDVKAATVWLRVNVDKGAVCRFAYSLDNQNFTPIGETFRASGDRWIGAKEGVIASAPPGATKTGHSDFDWCHVTPPIPLTEKSRQ